jgi:aspartyl-tRNA(Asn)/glutamyl-tRNA(Gln) amidotransferase subunit B
MEEGSIRIDANVSVRHPGAPFGTRCEIKNLNSLRSLQRAIDHEALRQIELIEEGGTVRQETRHWDEDMGETSTLRVKEDAEDYRYFRDPDLVDLAPSAAWQEQVRVAMGPMPAERRAALEALLGTPTDAQRDAVVVVIDLGLERFVHAAGEADADVAIALSRVANELAGDASLENLSLASFVATVSMEQSGALSATQAKNVLAELIASGGDPVSIAAAKGYEQLSSDSLESTIDELIAANPDEWGRYRDGDDKLAGFFTGLVMKATSGKANGKAVVAVLQSRR